MQYPSEPIGDDVDNFAYREHLKKTSARPEPQEREPTDVSHDQPSYDGRSSGRRRSDDSTRRSTGEREETSGRRRRQSGNYEAQRERDDYRSQPEDHRRQRDDYRDYRDDRQDGRDHRDETQGHKERRRRQSGDTEGQRERDDRRGSREEHRRHRRHSKKRGSLEGTEFQDVCMKYVWPVKVVICGKQIKPERGGVRWDIKTGLFQHYITNLFFFTVV